MFLSRGSGNAGLLRDADCLNEWHDCRSDCHRTDNDGALNRK